MLTSRAEKELFGEFARARCRALEDSSSFSSDGTYGLTDLGVGVEGQGINDPHTYRIDSQPVDNDSSPKGDVVDIRKLPGHD